MSNGDDRGGLRKAMAATYDATLGRVGDAVGTVAIGVTDNTARAVIEELEPYLIAEVIPDIVDGITPYLTETAVPQIVDAITPHLVQATVPAVLEGATPELVERLLPDLLEQLRPYLETELVPHVVDALVPHINEAVAPQIVEAVTPLVIEDVAPKIIEGLMPMIVSDVAPQVIEGVLPMIRSDVVPVIMDDFVDDPRVRSLIKEQSQALFLDALERARRGLARADDVVENIVRWVTRQPARMRLADAPPGRRVANAGVATRAASLALDLALIGFLVGLGVNTTLNLLDRIFDPTPDWLRLSIALIGFAVAPMYLGLCWTWFGQTVGDAVLGSRVARAGSQQRLGFSLALVKAFAGMMLLPLWIFGMITSAFNSQRRGLIDLLFPSQVLYVARYLYGIDPPGEAPHAGTTSGTGAIIGASVATPGIAQAADGDGVEQAARSEQVAAKVYPMGYSAGSN